MDEIDRLKELKRLKILDTPESEDYDAITREASEISMMPIALISLVDEHRLWFKSRVGLGATSADREAAFCSSAVEKCSQTLVVNDAWVDRRFAASRLVVNKPNIRFYAGAPIITSTGAALGALCVLDTVPREFSDEQVKQLETLALQVSEMIERDAEK